MDFIYQNPFRVLGLPVTATDREVSKRVNDLSTFAEFGKTVSYPTDVSFLSPLERTPETIEKAAQRIELSDRKLHYANFWFWIRNSVDELAIELLGEGEVAKALELWSRKLRGTPATAQNISNFKNYALLSFISESNNDSARLKPDPAKLEPFIKRTVGTIAHPSYEQIAGDIVGRAGTLQRDRHMIWFADELAKLVAAVEDENDGKTIKRAFISGFSKTGTDVKWHVAQKFTAQPIRRIETRIEQAAQLRDEDPGKAFKFAIDTAKSCEADLNLLKGLLPPTDPHLQNISDKLAEELLACGAAYFNAIQGAFRDKAIKNSKKLTMLAQRVAMGARAKKRVADDLAVLDKFAAEELLSGDTQAIISAINNCPRLDSPQLNAALLAGRVERLLEATRKPLHNLSSAGPEGKQVFLELGDVVANIALSMCIAYVNETGKLVQVGNLMDKIARLPMSAETRQRFNTNSKILENNRQAVRARQGAGGCYIATLVYGGYEQKQVVTLRAYRDNVLLRNQYGKKFVEIYYRVSPTVVKWLAPYPGVQRKIRFLLDRLVRRIQ